MHHKQYNVLNKAILKQDTCSRTNNIYVIYNFTNIILGHKFCLYKGNMNKLFNISEYQFFFTFVTGIAEYLLTTSKFVGRIKELINCTSLTSGILQIFSKNWLLLVTFHYFPKPLKRARISSYYLIYLFHDHLWVMYPLHTLLLIKEKDKSLISGK